MAEAVLLRAGSEIDYTADAAITGGEVRQLADGRAGVQPIDLASGALGSLAVRGIYTVAKTTSMVLLDGMPVFWDHSANKCHYKKVNDRDFYLGVCVGDCTSASTTANVAINVQPVWDIDIGRDAVLSVPSGTQAAGGFGFPKQLGGARSLELTSTSEVQKIDMLSVDRFDKNANAIVQIIFRLGTNGSTSAVDFDIGIANGTHATDFDSTTEHVAFHIDGGTLTILAQSKDGTTTVAATTTGVSATAASAVADRIECWIDTRVTTNVLLYVNGAAVATGSTFKIDASTGPWGLIAWLGKTTGTATAGPIYIDALRCHLAQQ